MNIIISYYSNSHFTPQAKDNILVTLK